MFGMKWALVLSTSLVVGGISAHADQDETVLKAKLEQSVRQDQRSAAAGNRQWQRSVKGIRNFQTQAAAQSKMCKDARNSVFSQKYALTFDENGKPCRIYDLSFPNLKAAFTGKSVSELPVQKLKAKDYLAWLKGDYEAVNRSMDDFKTNFNTDVVASESWVSELKFRNPPETVGALKGQGGLPASFRASDLDLGERFQFNEKDRETMKDMIAELRGVNVMGMGEVETQDFWMTMADRPETFLNKIRFDWNDARKVYEIFLEMDFLPLSGPVALVDYQAQYKMPVEKLIRSVMKTALRGLVKLVPTPMVSRVLDIAVTDSFEMIEMMYEYQMNQLEDTLRTVSNSPQAADIEAAQVQQGMNILFGSRSNLMMEYIMSFAQGKTFNWDQMDKIGRMSRYRTEKAREIMTAKMYSRLATKNGCQMQVVHANFGICSKDGEKKSVYSLISEQKVIAWNFGAPMVYRYERGYEVTAKRATSWLLAAGVRLFQLPYVSFLSTQLSYILKDFATSGIADEAILRNELWKQKMSGTTLDADTEKMLGWLYIQNINPFLPKSEAMEKSMIDKNMGLLKTEMN